jgi:hypothetical protein
MLPLAQMPSPWLSFALVWCAYDAGSFTSSAHDFTGTRTSASAGCLDLSVERRADTATGWVLAYDLGNRCDRPLTVDLKTASVVARTAEGDVAMVPFDPDREIEALPLDGRSLGGEAVEYRVATRGAPVIAICVDATGIVGALGTWTCFYNSPWLARGTR